MVTVIVAIAIGSAAPPAAADGDPASDVLASQPVFLPQDSGATAEQQAQLAALESAARKSGYQIRVAVIATRSDLGSVGALWQRPQSYAEFLGQELSLLFKGTLLVAMPNGFGVYAVGQRSAAGPSAIAAVRAPGSADIVGASVTAIERLAAASGHPLQAPSVAATAGATSDHLGSWIALAVGAAAIAAAWAASLRAKPPKLTRRSGAAP